MYSGAIKVNFEKIPALSLKHISNGRAKEPVILVDEMRCVVETE